MDSNKRVIQLSQIRQMLLDMPDGVSGLTRTNERYVYEHNDLRVDLDLNSGKLVFGRMGIEAEMEDRDVLDRLQTHMSEVIESYHLSNRLSILQRAQRSRNWKKE